MRLWRAHGLTITQAVLGAALLLPCLALPPGQAFDAFLTFGGAFVAVCVKDALAGWLRETNRPEE